MKTLKVLCGAALLVAASGVQADIVSVNDMDLAEVNGQLGYLDTTHIIAGLMGPAHESIHETDEAFRLGLGQTVDGAQQGLNSAIDNAQANFTATVDASQLNFVNLQANTEAKIANGIATVKQVRQRTRVFVSSVVAVVATGSNN